MILFFERKADKDGKRRLEVAIEEFEVQAGKRYLSTLFWKKEDDGGKTESVWDTREKCVRHAIFWFDRTKVDLWPEEA